MPATPVNTLASSPAEPSRFHVLLQTIKALLYSLRLFPYATISNAFNFFTPTIAFSAVQHFTGSPWTPLIASVGGLVLGSSYALVFFGPATAGGVMIALVVQGTVLTTWTTYPYIQHLSISILLMFTISVYILIHLFLFLIFTQWAQGEPEQFGAFGGFVVKIGALVKATRVSISDFIAPDTAAPHTLKPLPGRNLQASGSGISMLPVSPPAYSDLDSGNHFLNSSKVMNLV